MFLYYVTPATTKHVEELRTQRESLLKYKYDSRRTLRSMQQAYLRVRGERDNKDLRLKKAGAHIEKLQAIITTLQEDNKCLRNALLPPGESRPDNIMSGVEG